MPVNPAAAAPLSAERRSIPSLPFAIVLPYRNATRAARGVFDKMKYANVID